MAEWQIPADFEYLPPSLPPELCFAGTALQLAAATRNIGIVTALLQAGANINEKPHGRDGMTALHASVQFGDFEIGKLLLERGADANAEGSKMFEFPGTALLTAVDKKIDALVGLLLKLGADPNAVVLSDHGTTLLDVAKAQDVGCAITSMLVDAGAEESFEPTQLQKERCMKLQLPRAILRGDIEKVRDLEQMGVPLNLEPVEIGWSTECMGKDWNQWNCNRSITILHCAIMPRNDSIHLYDTFPLNDSIFRYLVKRISNINEQNASNTVEPILHEAVFQGRFDLVELLLDAGADINFVSQRDSSRYEHRKSTALHAAIAHGSIEMITLLLKRGANINLRASDESTPIQFSLHEAYQRRLVGEHGRIHITEHLLSHGADIVAPRASGSRFTLLQSAIGGAGIGKDPSVLTVIKSLVSISNVDELSRDGEAALTIAAREGNLDLVMLLLGKGADVDALRESDTALTALEAAAYKGHLSVAEVLIAKGSCINFRRFHECKSFSLGFAAANGRLDMVQLLINAGADLHLPQDKRYCHALEYARGKGHFGVASILQKYRDEAMEEWRQIRTLGLSSGEDREEWF